MKHVDAGVLNIAYLEEGPRDGTAVILLHGFPYDVHAYEGVSKLLAAAGLRCIVPYLRGYGGTTFRTKATMRSGQQAALGNDLLALMDALAIQSAFLAGYDWGGRAACIVAALWPQRVLGLVSSGDGYNIQSIRHGRVPLSAEAERRYWYQHYFQWERGRAGLEQNRHALCRLLWELWSPSWNFDAACFERSARAFDNPDFADVVIHSYRHRFGNAQGDPALESIEAQLALQPSIRVPSIVLQGADDGVDPPPATDVDAPHFTGRYERRTIQNVGHNVPQEAPEQFAAAILALANS
jgi:pimeloyl-ACP methyl ester carboxylesterase